MSRDPSRLASTPQSILVELASVICWRKVSYGPRFVSQRSVPDRGRHGRPPYCGRAPRFPLASSATQVVYTAMCYAHGDMIDDGTLFRLGDNNSRWIGDDDYSGIWLREQAEKLGLTAGIAPRPINCTMS